MSQKAGQPAQSHTHKGEKKYINQRKSASVTEVTPTFTPTLTASHHSPLGEGLEGKGKADRESTGGISGPFFERTIK